MDQAQEQMEKVSGDFAIQLYKHLAEESGNLFFAPLGILNAISMLLLGARDQCAKQIRDALGFGETPESDIHSANMNLLLRLEPRNDNLILKSRNGLFSDNGCMLKQEFAKSCRKFYLAEVANFDFAQNSEDASRKISEQVERETYGKVQNILSQGSIDSTTSLVLVNAVCFTGSWEQEFSEDATRDDSFFVKKSSFFRKDKTVAVRMMKREADFGYCEDKALRIQFLSVLYAGGEISMHILLPKKRFGLKRVERKLTHKKFSELVSNAVQRKVKLYLPKMKFEQAVDLARALKPLGVNDAFSSHDANLTAMSDEKDVFVSQAVQKTAMEVNEQGTEAYASMVGDVELKSSVREKKRQIIVLCNRPFLFIITHVETRSILFCGRFSDPPTVGS